jgi:hypothetical protein
MASRVVTKLVAAIAVTLAVELTEQILDHMGVSKETAKLPREIIKALAAAISGILTESALGDSADATFDDSGADVSG